MKQKIRSEGLNKKSDGGKADGKVKRINRRMWEEKACQYYCIFYRVPCPMRTSTKRKAWQNICQVIIKEQQSTKSKNKTKQNFKTPPDQIKTL